MSAVRERARTGYLRLTLLVAQREYLRTVRRRGYVFGTLLLPFGIAALMALSSFLSVAGGEADPLGVRIVVVNSSDVPLPAGGGIVRGLEVVPAEQAQAWLASGEISEYYEVPDTYPAQPTVARVESDSQLDVSAIEAHEAQEQGLDIALRQALLERAGLSADEARSILGGITVVAVSATGEPVDEFAAAASIVVPMVFVGLFIMSIFITSGYLLQSVTEEKENRVVEIVLSSVPSTPLMSGKIIGLGAAGLTQVAVWIATAVIAIPIVSDRIGGIGDVALDLSILPLAFVYFVLGYLAYGAIWAAIGAIAPGSREAQQYGSFFGFFPVIPFIALAAFLTDIGQPLVIALALFPLTTPTTMLLVLGLAKETPWELVGASLVSLTLFALVAAWASGRIFRATVLLYGVRPNLRTLLSAIREPR
jgi:ABC-2 type transport system permease protein